MKYYIIAGEPSGDLHGSNLMKGILKSDPEAKFRFWGGDKMASVGGQENLDKHYKQTSFFGILNVVKNIRTILGQIKECEKNILDFNPDVVIMIDYPSFNMQVAKWAKGRGIKTYYYIAPKVWAWKEWRVKQIKKYFDKVYVIFPFEIEYFKSKGIEVEYYGNPLTDPLNNLPESSFEDFARENHLDSRPVIALLAGSRRGEIYNNLPIMAQMSEKFPEYQFVVTGVDWLDKEHYRKNIGDYDVKVLYNKTYETLRVATAAIVTSGTATLETAMLGIPEVVIYKIHPVVEFLRPYVLKIPFVSLVNINLKFECVKEIVCSKFDFEYCCNSLREILPGGERREKMIKEFTTLNAMMGGPGTGERVGKSIAESL